MKKLQKKTRTTRILKKHRSRIHRRRHTRHQRRSRRNILHIQLGITNNTPHRTKTQRNRRNNKVLRKKQLRNTMALKDWKKVGTISYNWIKKNDSLEIILSKFSSLKEMMKRQNGQIQDASL